MRTTTKRTTSMLKVLALFLCFSFVFAFTLAISDGGLDPQLSPQLSNVADGYSAGTTFFDQNVSDSVPTGGEIKSPIASKMKLTHHMPYIPAYSRDWTSGEYTDNILDDNVSRLNKENHAAYHDNLSGGRNVYSAVGTYNNNPTWEFGSRGEAGEWQNGVTVAMQYKLPDDMQKLINVYGSGPTGKLHMGVKVWFTTKCGPGARSDLHLANKKLYIKGGAWDVLSMHKDRTSGANYNATDSINLEHSSNTIELTADDNMTVTLAVNFGWYANTPAWSEKDRIIQFIDLTVHVQFYFNSSTYTDADCTSYLINTNPDRETFTPYRDSNDNASLAEKDQWPLFYNSINFKAALTGAQDMGKGTQNVLLNSYTSSYLAGHEGFYKSASYTLQQSSESLIDYVVFRYESDDGQLKGEISFKNDYFARYVYGAFGLDALNPQNHNSGLTNLTLAGNNVGQLRVSCTSSQLNILSFEAYYARPGTYYTKVYSLSGTHVDHVVKVSGIDTTAAQTSDVTMAMNSAVSNKYATTGAYGSVDWVRTHNALSARLIFNAKNALDGYSSAYAIYYSVQKFETATEATSKHAPVIQQSMAANGDLVPLTVGPVRKGTTAFNLDFAYDFDLMAAKGINSNSYNSKAYVPEDGQTPTGSGYYRFDFYVFDLAGNAPDVAENARLAQSLYVKVDYETPAYNAEILYGDGEEKATLTSAQNGSWTTAHTQLRILFPAGVNLSGNTLVFTDSNSGTHTISFDVNGKIQYLDFENKLSADKVTFALANKLGTVTVTAYLEKAREDGDDLALVLDFGDGRGQNGEYLDVDLRSTFTMYTGVYANKDDLPKTTGATAGLTYLSNEWKEGRSTYGIINVRIDRNAPHYYDMELADRSNYLAELIEYSAPVQNRKWFTNGYNLPITASFDDSHKAAYGSDLKMFYAVATVANDTELKALEAKKVGENFKNINDDNYTDYVDFYGSWKNFTSGNRTESLDLVTAKGPGLKVVYVWSEDQAGNRSDRVKTYYVFTDPTSYSFSTDVTLDEGGVLKAENAKLSANRSTAKRGDPVRFTVSAQAGFVPYTVTGNFGGDTVTLVSNSTATFGGSGFDWTYDEGYHHFLSQLSASASESVIQFYYDNPDNYGAMGMGGFKLQFRKLVSSHITKNNVIYTMSPVVSPLEIEPKEAAESFVICYLNEAGEVLYADEDGSSTTVDTGTYFVPTNVGTYKLRAYLPDDDPVYVWDQIEANAGRSQLTTDVDFNILMATLTITPQAQQVVYGTAAHPQFVASMYIGDELHELTPEELQREQIVGSVKLFVDDYVDGAVLDVGKYLIVQDTTFDCTSGNFSVTFISGKQFTVTARTINIKSVAAEKFFGDDDPDFEFAVAKDQFGGEENALDILKKLFGDTYKDETSDYIFPSQHRITRQQSTTNVEYGGAVGSYRFVVSTAAFANIDTNYRIVHTVPQGVNFTIKQRPVTLTVKAYHQILGHDATFDKASVTEIPYALEAKDMRLADYIATLVHLALDGEPTDKTEGSSEFSKVEWYNVILNGAGNANVQLSLAEGEEGHVYIVRYAAETTVILSLKDGANFGIKFGTPWSDELIKYAADKFELSQTIDGVANITWTVQVQGAEAGNYLQRGVYSVLLTNIKLIGQDGRELTDGAGGSYTVVANAFDITVAPAEIVVVPKVQTWQKNYGDDDLAFGIGFEIKSINGVDYKNETFAGMTSEQLYQAISGSFARFRYSNTGGEVVKGALGVRFDDATSSDTNHTILDGSGAWYQLGVSRTFTSSDPNLTVSAGEIDPQRFEIKPVEITLVAENFVGVSKNYDGTTEVFYPEVVNYAYDLTSVLVNPSEVLNGTVYLAFDAVYDEAGQADSSLETGIRFSNIRLAGSRTYNYVLKGIKRTTDTDGAPKVFAKGDDPAMAQSKPKDQVVDLDGATVVIYYLDNSTLDIHITIYIGSIGVSKGNFVITKQYDNSGMLTLAHITMQGSNDPDFGGPEVLINALNAGKVTLLVDQTSAFGGSDVGSYGLKVALFFAIGSGYNILNNAPEIADRGVYNEADVSVQPHNLDGVDGILVIIDNITASITQRILGANSFTSLDAVDRDYNSKADVDMEFEFAEGAIAAGDTISSVGAKLLASISDGNNDAGEHTVQLTDGTVADENYAFDIDSINAAYADEDAITVLISPAKLVPTAKFEDRDYDGTTAVNVTEGATAFTTINFAEELAAELAQITLGGTIEYKLSVDGKENGNVVLDADGNATLHSVLVHGLTVTADANILKNYTLYGNCYVDDEKAPIGELTSGEVVADYEIEGAVLISKLSIGVSANDVTIGQKVYDGTRDAEVSGTVPAGVLESEKDKLQLVVYGTFETDQVGTSLTVNLNQAKLVAISDDYAYLLDNYNLEQYSERRTADIVARPVSVSATVADREYNGLASIQDSLLGFQTSGLLSFEENLYTVLAGSASYLDKNVELQKSTSGEVLRNQLGEATPIKKPAAIFNPSIVSGGNISNYVAAEELTPADFKEQSDREILGVKVMLADGDYQWLYYEAANEYNTAHSDLVVAYLCALRSTDKFIEISDDNAEAINAAIEAGKVIGRYAANDTEYYALASDYEVADNVQTLEKASYILTSGIIRQKAVSIAQDGITKLKDDAYNKAYDGTSRFNGKVDVDYSFAEAAVTGIVAGDQVQLASVTAKFDAANTYASYVVFTANGIKGEDADNYTVAAGVTELRIPARITRLEVTAHLNNSKMRYGTNLSDIAADVTYRIDETADGVLKIAADGMLYVKYAKFVELAFGEDGEASLTNDEKAELAQNRYGIDGDNVAERNDSGDWYRFTVNEYPRAAATFLSKKPNAGNVSSTFTFASLGSSTEVAFKAEYEAEGSKLEVTPYDLFVVPDSAAVNYAYSAVYGNIVGVTATYLDIYGNPSNFTTGEDQTTLFKNVQVNGQRMSNIAPVFNWYIYDTTTGAIVGDKPIDKYAVISSALPANQCYVGMFGPAKDANGADIDYTKLTGEAISNYVLHFGSIVAADQNMFALSFADTPYEGGQAFTSQLTIVKPKLTNIALTASATASTIETTYDGTNKAMPYVMGSLTSDKVRIGGQEPVKAGTYTGYVTVTRRLSNDANDPNKNKDWFTYEDWTSASPMTIIINKAIAPIRLKASSFTYTGKRAAFNTNNVLVVESSQFGADAGMFDWHYYKLDKASGTYSEIQLNDLIDVGTYKVKAVAKASTTSYYSDYEPIELEAALTITAAVADVTLQNIEAYNLGTGLGGAIKLSALYATDKDFAFDYNIVMRTAIGDYSVGKEDTELVIRKNGAIVQSISGPGVYTFKIGFKSDAVTSDDGGVTRKSSNYVLAGASGTIEITANTFYMAGEGGGSLSLLDAQGNLASEGVIGDRLSVRRITQNSPTGIDARDWRLINAYIPHISSQATLKCVLRLAVMNGDATVNVSGPMRISVALPEGIDNLDNTVIYVVNSEGGLTKLKNYTVENGRITYQTDFLGAIVFVGLEAQGMPAWALYTAIGGGSFVGLTLIVAVFMFVLRKIKLKKLTD